MKTTLQKTVIAIVFFSLVAMPISSQAYVVEKHPEAPAENRFVVGPAKVELTVGAGESKQAFISVENRMGAKQTFVISFEDFVGTKDANETIHLLGTEKSNSSLKDSLYVEQREFTLDQGDRAMIPVTVSVSANTNPGGLFGAVVVSATKNKSGIDANDRAYTGATVLGRIATLFFITVPGNVTNDGKLTSFTTKEHKTFFSTSEIPVRLTFENNGNVNLNPYGGIVVKNMFGNVVTKERLNPWYALPNSIRTRDVLIVSSGMFGKYTATAEINRGYGNVVDEKSVTFYVITPGISILILIGLVILCYAGKKFFVRTKTIA